MIIEDMSKYSKTHHERGSVLVATIMILMLLSIIGTAALDNTNTELLIARNEKINTQSFYLAEAGIEHAKTRLSKNNSLNDFSRQLGIGRYIVNSTYSNSNNEYEINSRGIE